jgi:hypothetical protein
MTADLKKLSEPNANALLATARMMKQIISILDSIELADVQREAVRKASDTFQKGLPQ